MFTKLSRKKLFLKMALEDGLIVTIAFIENTDFLTAMDAKVSLRDFPADGAD